MSISTEISDWINRKLAGKSSEAIMWHRTVGKLTEEIGEVAEALIAATDGNPRKEAGGYDDVSKELLDVAATAVLGWAHINGPGGVGALVDHLSHLHKRAGLSE